MINYELYEYNIINFLKENNALEKFNYNIQKNGRNILYLYNNHINFKWFLVYSFSWNHTPEGVDYWAELNNKLEKYKLKEINNIDIWND
jgi:hypothetical protein